MCLFIFARQFFYIIPRHQFTVYIISSMCLRGAEVGKGVLSVRLFVGAARECVCTHGSGYVFCVNNDCLCYILGKDTFSLKAEMLG